jgi:thymidine kinase
MKGVRVILAGLDMDYKGIPFGPMPQLMAIAEYVTKVHAICVSCGNLAQFSHRTASETDQVLVGAIEKYKPLCRTCYNKLAH